MKVQGDPKRKNPHLAMRVFWFPGCSVLCLVADPHRPRAIVRTQGIAVGVVHDGGAAGRHGRNLTRA
ncbi:hypothetical protein OU568_27000, partial [Escherichia coli]|nr:hypothetical protein [Escherichia coli]